MTIQPQIQAALIKVNGFITRYPTLCQYEMLKAIEKKTKYDMAYFFLLFCSLIGFCLYFVGGGKLITDLVSFIYPAYQSFKAIDSVDPTDDTQWLTYWVVFAFVSIIENVFTIIADVIPFYFVMKVGFFVWLYHPKFLGAGLVYSQGIKPFILPYLNTSMEKKSVEKKSVQKKTE